MTGKDVPDLQTDAPDTDYFVLGDGRTTAIIQWSRNPAMSPYGIALHATERMSRKNGSLLFHPELGLSRTMLTVTVDGVRYRPRHESVQAAWNLDERPSVIVRWMAGTVEVIERFTIESDALDTESSLRRDLRLSAPDAVDVTVEAALYANPILFHDFEAHPDGALRVSGLMTVELRSAPRGVPFERFLTVHSVAAPELPASPSVTFLYTARSIDRENSTREPIVEIPLPASMAGAGVGDGRGDSEPSLASWIALTYEIACVSLRGAIARDGRFNASIWQYDFEWGMDAAMIATAAVSAGMFDLGRSILVNILDRLTSDNGMISEASRYRGGAMSELNGNGVVLDAVWHYWRWTGDDELLRTWWHRITAVADYLLRPEYTHESGLLLSRRDLWERFPWSGVKPGFELGHQVFCAVGLRHVAEAAEALGDTAAATRWRDAADRIGRAMLDHPRYSLVENGSFIHRRLVDGSVQEYLIPEPTPDFPEYAPFIPPMEEVSRPLPCEPDIAEALPIAYGLVDGGSELAHRTLEKLSTLWSPTGIGGYARYNIASDPDSPGPWPFATAFVAAAELEAGLDERARASIEWLLRTAGAGGSWLEYYGERETPPYPPVGLIVWGWAQFVILVVKHLLGVRVEKDRLRIAPRMIGIDQTIRFGGHSIHVTVQGFGAARLDGAPFVLDGRAASIELPLANNHRLEFLP